MALPAEVEALSAALRAAYRLADEEIQAELEAIASLSDTEQARRSRRVVRLREVEASIAERLDILDSFARAWLSESMPVIYRAGANGAAVILGESFIWSQADLVAIAELTQATWDDLLAASQNMRESVKRVVRELARERAVVGRITGETATQSARRLRDQLIRRGVTAAVYRDGSRHGIGEYASAVIRTRTAVAHNAGAVNMANRMGVQFMECLDSNECGLNGHSDTEKPNGNVYPIDTAATFAISHVNCVRSWAPRPDVTTADEARRARPSTTEAQRTDQEAFERQREEATRERARRRAAQRRKERQSARS